MELASLIEDLGKACGLELTLDEGRCTLRFDGEHDVTIERDGNAVILHGIAGDGGCLSNPDNLRILLTVACLCYDLLPLALQQAGQVFRNPHPRAYRHHLQSGWRGTQGATAYDSEWECSLYY